MIAISLGYYLSHGERVPLVTVAYFSIYVFFVGIVGFASKLVFDAAQNRKSEELQENFLGVVEESYKNLYLSKRLNLANLTDDVKNNKIASEILSKSHPSSREIYYAFDIHFGKEIAEVPASWFGVLNSLFIIAFAPLFSKWWESKYNPNANMKYAIGMVLLGIGMACVAIGASSIEPGAKTASVSMIWLILVYFFYTMGELCISPVALSYVSKLVPGRMIAMMFGIWYLAVAIGMKLAGVFGEASEGIAQSEGLSYFFWLLTAVAVGLGVISALLYPVIKKLMHGVR